MKSFNEIVNEAARDIREGFEIRLRVQNGYGEIEVVEIESEQKIDFGTNYDRDNNVEEQFQMAIDFLRSKDA